MLLQFASASLMNRIDNRAKGPYVLKRHQARVRWAGSCSGVLLFQGCPGHCKTQAQILPYTKLQHWGRPSPTPACNQLELCA